MSQKQMKLFSKQQFLFFILCTVLVTSFAVTLPAFAQGGADAIIGGAKVSADKAGLNTDASGTGQEFLSQAAGRFINTIFGLMGVIFMTVVLIGGYLWMTAGGNEEKIGKAKGWVINGINGMIVMFFAYVLVYTILYALNAATNGS